MRELLQGETHGNKQTLRHISQDRVAAFCAASIRSQCIEDTRAVAEWLGVPLLLQPRRVESEFAKFLGAIEALSLDLIVVNSYSMVIPPEVLDMSHLGGVHIRASLLPNNRRPNPIR